MRCIVHFGMHKTGSTSIQETLIRIKKNTNFCYPNFQTAAHNGVLVTAFSKKIGIRHGKISREQYTKKQHRLLEKMVNTINDCNRDLYLLSAEGILGLDNNELQDLINFLKSHFKNVRAVGYVRGPHSYIESSYQEMLKSGVNCKIELTHAYPFYEKRLGKIEKCFGRNNVTYWHFSKKSLYQQCAVQDFIKRLDLQMDDLEIKRANESLSMSAVKLLRAYRKHGPAVKPVQAFAIKRQRFIDVFLSLKGDKFRISSQLTKPIIEKNKEDVSWMESRLGISLDEPQKAEGAITCLDDFETFDSDSLVWLEEECGINRGLLSGRNVNPEEIARYVHSIYKKVCDDVDQNFMVKKNTSPTRITKE